MRVPALELERGKETNLVLSANLQGQQVTPEQIEEMQKHRLAVNKAQELYDAGYEAREEYPGKLMPYGTWDMIDVPIETWYFFRGIIFGKGDTALREINK